MENQHRHIKGYRELSADEIALMNLIKDVERQCLQLVNQVHDHLVDNYNELDMLRRSGSCIEEFNRFNAAEPKRWVSIAKTDIQTGFMALVRAVAQPSSN